MSEGAILGIGALCVLIIALGRFAFAQQVKKGMARKRDDR